MSSCIFQLCQAHQPGGIKSIEIWGKKKKTTAVLFALGLQEPSLSLNWCRIQ